MTKTLYTVKIGSDPMRLPTSLDALEDGTAGKATGDGDGATGGALHEGQTGLSASRVAGRPYDSDVDHDSLDEFMGLLNGLQGRLNVQSNDYN